MAVTTLRELQDANLLTVDEVTEASCYVTTDPATVEQMPGWLWEKILHGAELLALDESRMNRH